MNEDAYIALTDETATYKDAGRGTVRELTYLALGIAGEAGEVADKVKKILRDLDIDEDAPLATLPPQVRSAILKELGDVEWYQTRMLKALDYDHASVREMNKNKLLDRKARGVMAGSGDDR